MDVVRLGILGGTFDPIHNGHLNLAHNAYRALTLDKILFVPAGEPPHKQITYLTDAAHRLKMVELAISSYPNFAVSRVDLDRPGPHYTVDMISALRSTYKLSAETCFFIIGTDSLVALPTWHASDKLLALCRLGVVHRPHYYPNLADLTALFPDLRQKIVWIEMPPDPISSTRLREQIARGEDVTRLLPTAVLVYIQQTGLYCRQVRD